MQSRARSGHDYLCYARPSSSGRRNVGQSLYLSPGGSTALEREERDLEAQSGPYHLGGGDHAIHTHRDSHGSGNAFRSTRQPSLSRPVVRGHEQGRRLICLQLQHANFRPVRLGGDCREPRILQSEPVLPRARRAATQGQTKALLVLIAIRRVAKVRPCSRENGSERLPPSKCIIVLLDPFEDEGFLHR